MAFVVVCFWRMVRTQALWIVGVVLVLGASAVWQFRDSTAELQPSSPTGFEPPTLESNGVLPGFEVSSSLEIKPTAETPSRQPIQTTFTFDKRDTVASWNFAGAYTGNPELVVKAQNEIARLSRELTTATSSAMILAVGIANQYELLGDGGNQYEYLKRAVLASPENGLPWHNMGVLMERLGALETARTAYGKAALLQAQLEVYHYARLQFLTTYFKSDTVGIESAFMLAEKNIGKTQYLADLRAQWQKP